MADKADDEKAVGSRIIGRILPAAVQLWLRSQVERVGQLSVDLAGRDRQIIKGHLPGVSVTAQDAVYQGICVGQVQMSAEDIRVNIGQVIRGKPLKLLNAFPVSGEVTLGSQDLSDSVTSPLLQEGLNNFWRSLLALPSFVEEVENRYGKMAVHVEMTLHQPQIRLGTDRLALSFYPSPPLEVAETPVVLGAGLAIVEGHFLQLKNPCWLSSLEAIDQAEAGVPVQSLQNFRTDLGHDTQLSQLSLQPTQLHCCGQVMVLP